MDVFLLCRRRLLVLKERLTWCGGRGDVSAENCVAYMLVCVVFCVCVCTVCLFKRPTSAFGVVLLSVGL